MRQVKAVRKSRGGGRGKAGRVSARIARIKEPPRQSFGRRTSFSDGVFSRALRRLKGWFSFSRPVLALSAGFFLFVVVASLFIGGYVGRTINGVNAGLDALVADAGFGISEIHLSGNLRTPPETILAALGFEPGQSIFDADLRGARARLLGLDWISSAEVRRRYPDSISVSVVEKRPFALWQSQQGTLYVIERAGDPITSKDIGPFAHLPLLIGAGANKGADIVAAVAAHRAVFARVRGIERVSDRRWNLLLDDGVVVKLPEEGWRGELDTLEHLIIDKAILERNVSEIDLRSKSHYFFVLRGAQKTEERGSGI